MLKYCRHCDRTILPDANESCPGCRSAEFLQDSPPETAGSAAGLLLARLRGHAAFPVVCAFCGVPSTESKVFTWRRKSPHVSGGDSAAAYFSVVWRIFEKLVRQQEQVISFRLPHCGNCRMMRLEIARFEWDDYCILAYCHPNFCEELKASGRR